LFLVLLIATLSGCDDTPKVRLVGSPAPDFTLQDSDHAVSLHDFRGKLVILNFWTSWCEPCIEEMPSLIRMQAQMSPRVTVLGVSTDIDEGKYHKFLRDFKVNFPTVWDPKRKSSDMYGTTGQPETFVIDSSGMLRRKFIGPIDWTSPEIVEYLNKL